MSFLFTVFQSIHASSHMMLTVFLLITQNLVASCCLQVNDRARLILSHFKKKKIWWKIQNFKNNFEKQIHSFSSCLKAWTKLTWSWNGYVGSQPKGSYDPLCFRNMSQSVTLFFGLCPRRLLQKHPKSFWLSFAVWCFIEFFRPKSID